MPSDDLPEWIQRYRWQVGETIRRLRRERGLTQEQLAEAAGVDNKTISRAENGVHEIGLDLIVRLSMALGVPPWTLLREP